MINESRLLNEANSFFTQRKFEKALFLYSQLSSEFPDNKEFLALDEVESSDWFLVSSVTKNKQNSDILGTFQVDTNVFEVYKANAHKCPRCWKYTALEEDTLCQRCDEVLN